MAIIVEEGGYVVISVLIILALLALLLLVAPYFLKDTSLSQALWNLLSGGG